MVAVSALWTMLSSFALSNARIHLEESSSSFKEVSAIEKICYQVTNKCLLLTGACGYAQIHLVQISARLEKNVVTQGKFPAH